jgi:hypothetical protein
MAVGTLRTQMLQRMLQRRKRPEPKIDVPTVIVNVDLQSALDKLTDGDGRLKVTDKFSPSAS